MIAETFHLQRGAGRPSSIDHLLDFLMHLPPDKRFTIEVEEYRERLPQNYLARIKIPVRELAKFHGIEYEEMNEIVHDHYYPKHVKRVGGVEYEISVPSMKLTALEARKIEADLHRLAGEVGCTLTLPQDF